MKTSTLTLLCLLFFCLSCQKEDNPQAPTLNNKSIELQGKNRHAEPTAAEILENKMEWASYLIAHTLINDANAEAQFISLINASINSTSTISLESLLGSHVSNTSFLDAFENSFLEFLSGENCLKCPKGDLQPDCQGGDCAFPCSSFCMFLTYLLEENCFEIYLPNGYDGTVDIVSSTAHPVNTDNENDCYIRDADDVLFDSINVLNMSTFENPIVVRPYDNLYMVDECDYSEFSLDFTLFLDN